MPSKTNDADAAGLQRVIEALRKEHRYPHAFIASQLQLSRQSVIAWKAVPLAYVEFIAKLSGVPAEKILPYTLKRLKKLTEGINA
jgi:hypothetical protein